MRRLAVLLLLVLAGACGGDDDEAAETVTVTVTTTTTTTTTAPTTTSAAPGTWAGIPEPPPADGSLPVEEFNAYAESVDEPWERDIALVTAEFVRRDETEAGSSSYQGTSNGGTATTSLVLDGLFDDSVRARRYDLTLSRRPDGTWRIDTARWAQRCQPGRGHQAFTPALCV
jgi:hypothetical protein